MEDLPVDFDALFEEDLACVFGDGLEAAGRECEDRGACAGETYAEQTWMRRGGDTGRYFWETGDLEKRTKKKLKKGKKQARKCEKRTRVLR